MAGENDVSNETGVFESSIATLVSGPSSVSVLSDVEINDLNTGRKYTVDDFQVEVGHIYRVKTVFYSSYGFIKDVNLYADLPRGDSNTITFIVRELPSGDPLSKVTITCDSLNLSYIKGSAVCNQFNDAITEVSKYHFKQLTLPSKGMDLGNLHELENDVPFTIIMDFQVKSEADNSNDWLWILVGVIGIVAGVMLLVFYAGVMFQRRNEENDENDDEDDEDDGDDDDEGDDEEDEGDNEAGSEKELLKTSEAEVSEALASQKSRK